MQDLMSLDQTRYSISSKACMETNSSNTTAISVLKESSHKEDRCPKKTRRNFLPTFLAFITTSELGYHMIERTVVVFRKNRIYKHNGVYFSRILECMLAGVLNGNTEASIR
ncbi:hypothetical protein SOMG_02462 [Schizosaccharomyces osmophilus]|uniref:Uncharacterized protein n=1 Tax=Schizosaccharomyces osmophilus TaxID=2545709 RepID=A0AAE9WAI5_9SCHI|nr:uncharacterized protein SOMG_02462 [Schizosaccharomyces osmophilus]WBW72310.1 hypothetical protein SOMG_02462 [Schizosaccharomyces osmophilus]